MEGEFTDLPAALVEEMLSHASRAGDFLVGSLNGLRDRKDFLRRELEKRGLLLRDSSFGFPPFPTVCGIDGSFAVERLLSVDLVAAAALAVEGFEPPGTENPWKTPKHELFTAPEPHDLETVQVLKACMLGMEASLASRAPHDVVMLDMTLTLPASALSAGLRTAVKRTRLRTSLEFLSGFPLFLESFATVLTSTRTDRQFAGLPKYTARREVGRLLPGRQEEDDRAFLTTVLAPGELTSPLPLELSPEETDPEVLFGEPAAGEEIRHAAVRYGEEIRTGLRNLRVFYYRPHEWLPALRVEVPLPVALNPGRMAVVLQSLKHQCSTAAMFEPYPLYMADRMAKTIARSIPAFRQIALREAASKYRGDAGELFFSLHGYRSEGGQ